MKPGYLLGILSILLLMVHCAPSRPEPISSAPIVLSPTERGKPFPIERKGKQLVAQVEIKVPGTIHTENLPEGATAWLTDDPNDRSPAKQPLYLDPPPHFSAVVAVGKPWYLFVHMKDRPPITQFALLVYEPDWGPIEKAYDSLKVETSQPHPDLQALYRSVEQRITELDIIHANYRQWTEELYRNLHTLRFEIIERLLPGYLEQARGWLQQKEYDQAGQTLERVADYLKQLPPESAKPFQDRLNDLRMRQAKGIFLRQLNSASLEDLLGYCAQTSLPTTDDFSVPGSRSDQDIDAVCQVLAMIKAKRLFDEAEEHLIEHPEQAKTPVRSAQTYLERGALQPLSAVAWQRAQNALAEARREDLLTEAVVFSAPELLARGRLLEELTTRAEEASRFFAAYRSISSKAESEAQQAKYKVALQLSREALKNAAQAEGQWVEIEKRMPQSPLKGLSVFRDEVASFEKERANWVAYEKYQSKLKSWLDIFNWAEQVTGPDVARNARRTMNQIMKELGESRKPPGAPGPKPQDLLSRARWIRRKLGIPIVQEGVTPAVLGNARYDELVRYYRMAEEALELGTKLAEDLSQSMKQAESTFKEQAKRVAQSEIDTALHSYDWDRAEEWVRRAVAFDPTLANRLKTRVAVSRARYLRDQAQQDLERAYVAEALIKYQKAHEIIGPYIVRDGAAREIYDFVGLEIKNLKSQNIPLIRLETTLLPLEACLETSQPLPQGLPFTLIIREGLTAFPQAREDYYIRGYDIELVVPKEDQEKFTFVSMTTSKKEPIPFEITDLLDGQVSIVFKITSLPEPPDVQITFDGGNLDLQSIGKRWFIHKGTLP